MSDNIAPNVMVKGFEMAIEEVFEYYSEDFFTEPTHEEYEEMNRNFSSFVSRHSASVGRHIAKVIRERALEFAKEILEEQTIDDGFGQSVDAVCPDCGVAAKYVSRPGDFRCGNCEERE